MHGHLVNVTPTISTRGIQRASFQMLVDIWIDSIVRDVPPAIPSSEGLLINRLADAFYRSSSDRCEVALSSEKPRP